MVARRTAQQERAGGAGQSRAKATAERRSNSVRQAGTAQLDRVIHERVRLAIVSALASAQSLTFSELRDLLEITDGNLSVHARRLEEAGFIDCHKSFVDRVPRTEFHLTPAGRKALDDYLGHMESLIRQVRRG